MSRAPPYLSTTPPMLSSQNQDPEKLMNQYRSYVSIIIEAGVKEESKLKALQELSQELESIVANPQYPSFLEHMLKVFIRILQEGEPDFILEHTPHQMRKLILEIIHRIPTNQTLLPHVKNILNVMFKLLEIENEENVLVVLRIIIEFHKTFRPPYSAEIANFLAYVKGIYGELPSHLDDIFDPRPTPKVKDATMASLAPLLENTYSMTLILCERRGQEQPEQLNLIPKATKSLKALAELPIIVVLMYQLYKQNVHNDVQEFIPLIMATISLQPSQQHRSNAQFNQEVFVDFMAAQIKTLSFLAYIVRIYQSVVNEHSSQLARGMLGLLTLCPQEVAHLRKELLIAARHILATELRDKFVGCLEELFDENVLIGTGWTAHESLRPLAYSTLADLVHHIRQHLPLCVLSRAVNVFSKNVHDESLVTTIQTMSCKLLLNLVECIRTRSDRENGNGRELLMRLLEILVIKLKTISKLQIPVLIMKARQQTHQIVPGLGGHLINPPRLPFLPPEVKTEAKAEEGGTKPPTPQSFPAGLLENREDKILFTPTTVRFGFPTSQASNYSILDCRSLVKTIICGSKSVAWGIQMCKVPGQGDATPTSPLNKQFHPKETLVFIRLLKYALHALDVFTIVHPSNVTQTQLPNRQMATITPIRSKDEKETIEYLAQTFNLMHPLTFREVFSTTIDFFVDRMYKNPALQIMVNSFLAHDTSSHIFATILVEYLLKRMEEMGSSMERSNLYLKLFKMVFGCVSLFAAANEEMLKPYLHQIVNRSMELALSAREPYNYFLLLRALFRSIGGGSHDLLYQEFLPLLPNLLQGLNSLQSGLHKQHMKDLFVELCLTVPVRLSSLLPYLPMLMDPLVSALNGSQTLVSQGLRTLELCVDNLQPEFLYDHIQPVRAELMQALWRTLRNPSDSIAQVAFRVLGKFGGGNRKMMIEPQKLDYCSRESNGPCIAVHFPEHKTSISVPFGNVIETACNALKTSSTNEFYRKQCWGAIKCFLSANIKLDDEKNNIAQLLQHPSFRNGEIPSLQTPQTYYICPDSETRKVHELALTGMFVASAIKELRPVVLPFMPMIVRHYTMVAVAQQAGPFAASTPVHQGMDSLVLVDAIAQVMGHEEKELCKPGGLALVVVIDTATIILGSKKRACSLPLIEYLSEKMCALCYERAWYAKLGGCHAIKQLLEHCHPVWVYAHLYTFLKALLFVMMDLTGEVSSGATDYAKTYLENMLRRYCKPCIGEEKDVAEAQTKAINEVVQELVRQLTQPNTCVREQAMHSLRVIAEVMGKTVTAVLEPHRDLLADYVPLRKHNLRHQPVMCQIGLLDGNTFCITLEPRLFSYDLTNPDHKTFFDELVMLCEMDNAALQKLPCYKGLSNLIPVRRAMLRLLAACHHMADKRGDIFKHLYQALSSPVAELQEVGYTCMRDILSKCDIECDMVHLTIRPLLLTLGDHRNLRLPTIQQLSYLTLLFPKLFNDKLCDQLLVFLRRCMEDAEAAVRLNDRTAMPQEVKICTGIINIFHQIPAASTKFIEPLLSIVLATEKNLMMEAGSPYREPLVKFLQRYPGQTVELLLSDTNTQDEQVTRFLEYLLKLGGEPGRAFREVLQANPGRLVSMAFPSGAQATNVQHQAIRIVSLLSKADAQWLSDQHQLVACLRKIWISKDFQERHLQGDTIDYTQWKEPKLLAKCLLNFVKHHPSEVELLFQLLRAFTGRFIPDFDFLRDFLETVVAGSYTVDWKRTAFFKFVELFCDETFPQDLKAKILQFVLIPSFSTSFERGEGERLIGGPPSPDTDQNENVMSVFINRVIDSERPFRTSDAVRILLLQFSCLLVEQASPHIHDAANKRQGNKLRRLMTFAWPCLLTKNCVDPATKYHGHLLLANIIAKFAIHKRIVLQVFHSLLKAHAAEARGVVRQALEILTPAMPMRMEDGNNMLTHWTKKIIVEEGHTLAQLVHMLQLLVRHYKVYYPVRHHLISHMVSSVQRLVFTPNATIEHKRLAVDLAEVIIRWEIQRHKEEAEKKATGIDRNEVPEERPAQTAMISLKRTSTEMMEGKRTRHPSGSTSHGVSLPKHDRYKPVEKEHSDAVVNFLLRMACQVNESSSSSGTTGELLSRRCVSLLKTALKQDVWPHAEIKLGWSDKLLNTVKETQTTPNIGNICTALELLAFLVSNLRKEAILTTFKPLQRGIAACLSCNHIKVIKSVHQLLTRLMQLFPTEPTNSTVASKYEELEGLYGVVSNVIMEGLTNYEKSTASAPQTLYSTLMFLKAAILSNPCYIDRLISTFMRVLQKLTKEHLIPPPDEVGTDMLILCLDFVKNRVGVMGSDMRKVYVGNILCSLIERSSDAKVLKAITKMVEEWVKSKSTIAVNQGPNLKEKTILLVKMMQFLEKRFPNDLDLNAQFLELVHYVYKDESLKSSELGAKLEPAFLAGLRCVQPHIRAKFFEVFDGSIRRKLYERVLYIGCSQNWDLIGPHFWIKQAIELVLVTATDGAAVQSATPATMLPAITAVVEHADPKDRATFAMSSLVVKESSPDVVSVEPKEEDMEIDLNPGEAASKDATKVSLQALLKKQAKLQEILHQVSTSQLLGCTSQLCHLDTPLAAKLWVTLFPRLWKIFSDKQQTNLSSELVHFISSGIHLGQMDCHPDATGIWTEGMMLCSPAIPIKPFMLKYQGTSHNLWHRACLQLEHACAERGHMSARSASQEGKTEADESLDILCELYSSLREEDLWGGLWAKRARYEETTGAVQFEQQGQFLSALEWYRAALTRQQVENTPMPMHLNSEVKMWVNQIIRCHRELNDWEGLLTLGTGMQDWNLVLESAWRQQPNWNLMKEAAAQVELTCRREEMWKLHLYKGYLSICHKDERNLASVEKTVELCSNLCIKEWRRLPHVVSHIHLPILQAAQQIIELQDAVQIHQGLQPTHIGRNASLHEMKAIVKTWRNRLPVVSDDLSHWSEIFYWRQEHYRAIVSSYEGAPQTTPPSEVQANHAMLGVHASAQSIIHYGKVARKHGLTSVCLDALGQIHSIPSVPIVDCFQKIRQQVKCYLQKAHAAGRNEIAETTTSLHEGLNVIESTNLKYFTKEMTAEFYALKGVFLAQLGRADESNKVFSASVQLHDTLVKGWALWGDYMEQLFTKEKPENRNMGYGISAMTCYLHSCRHQNESKARKYLAKILWLLTFDDQKGSLSETIEKNFVPVPALQWLPWIPQLLTCLVQTEGRPILNILSHVGRVYPQAVYFPIRTLYLILKIEQREKHKSSSAQSTTPSPAVSMGENSTTNSNEFPPSTTPSAESLPIRATQPMWRCSRIMHMQRDIHPTVLSCLEGIVDQMVWFRENVYEEVLRQLRQALAKCYAVAYENAGAVSEAPVTPHTLSFVKKLVSTFGIGVENVSGHAAGSSSASESLARRAQATAQDPVFQRMKGQFTADFDFTVPGAMKLHNLISKLKKWIKILESKTKILPKSFLIEEKCRFLNNFAQQTADVEIPGEFLLPRHNHYFVRIARFMPKYDIVQKHNAAARRIYIKGHNGKIYPYLVVNDACLSDARREERVLQLLRMLNHYLGKQKETAKRFLNFTVPRVVPVSPQMRLVEDNESSVSLLDIYKQRCAKRGIEYDAPLARFYERLATVQARGSQASHQVLRDILKDVQSIMVSRTLLKDWVEQTYPAATDYWTFRKQFTLQLSLAGFIEFVLHLSRLNPDMMYVHQDSGLMNVSYFRFNIEDSKGELEANRPVPFRLTPNIAEFITPIGVSGPMTASIVAAARCLAMPNFKVISILRAILKDEMTAWYKKRQDDSPNPDPKDAEGPAIVAMVNKATGLIMGRLNGLCSTQQVSTLVAVANSHDNLCRMDPAWHPWL